MSKGERDGDWLLVLEDFERGESSFVDEIRKFDDADRLGSFAIRWIADTRPEARRLLSEYLDRPLDAFRHEALLKRMFKIAEANGDDELMAWFLVAFDRSVRRVQRRRRHFECEYVKTEAEANDLATCWRNAGFIDVNIWQNWQKQYQVFGRWDEPIATTPRDSTMPRGTMKVVKDYSAWNPITKVIKTYSVPDWVFTLKLDRESYQGEGRRIPETGRKNLQSRRLFSVATRHYLRRRCWRYFRKLGRTHPERYINGVLHALIRYQDDDVADGLSLLDNWGLTHILFHFSPCLRFDDHVFHVAEGHSLTELEPAPKYVKHWNMQSRAFIDLLLKAKCRAVRSWSVRMIRHNLSAFASLFTLEERLKLLSDDDPDVVNLAADLLRDDPSLRAIPVEQWFRVLETASPTALDIVCELMERFIGSDRIAATDAAKLAMSRPLPIASLGFQWLKAKVPRDEVECRTWLELAHSECEALRPEIIEWAASVLSKSDWFRVDWVLEWLDSRHLDVRQEAWKWFQNEPRANDDVVIWQKLMETPYDEIRLALVADLELRTRTTNSHALSRRDLDPELVRLLWASVLLNIYRGNRAKPIVVRQLLSRLESKPDELPRLLPLLAVALRSVRGSEWRTGLVALVRLSETFPSSVETIRRAFPELQLT